MGGWDGYKNNAAAHVLALAPLVAIFALTGCSGTFQTEPLVEYSTEVNVQGEKALSVARAVRAGVYLIEVRERDIDLRVQVDAGTTNVQLADVYQRHGLHRTVVSLEAPQTVHITLSSVDQRRWRGAAAVRILRWPHAAPDAPPDERLLGFVALGRGNAFIAGDSRKSWRAAAESLRAAAAHFRAANDVKSQAEAEYKLGQLEFSLLLDFDAARRTAESAKTHFRAADDWLGTKRANVLLGRAEMEIANDVEGAEKRALVEVALERFVKAQEYFEAHGEETDALRALSLRAASLALGGQHDEHLELHEEVRERARARGDKHFEASATHHLAAAASLRGEISRAAGMYESVLPLIERQRNPDLYATIVASLGACLVQLGDFDRALLLQTDALQLFSSRGDDAQTARSLTILGSIQFRTGDVARAFDSLRSALPLYERGGDTAGLASALRLTGNVAAELDKHDLALEYLRDAERLARDPDTLERTRVLIAGVLRTLGNLRGADELLATVLRTRNEHTRADALAERASLRHRQNRAPDALADLAEADAIYARLKLDFNRIDTSSALALARLATADLSGATAAADAAVEIERRIRVKSANPELRARFLSASYAPYEARIEVDFAGGAPRDPGAAWRAFRTAEAVRARSLADRLAHGRNSGRIPRDDEIERLGERMTALHVELELRTRHSDGDAAGILELRRHIDETRARLEARLLGQRAVIAREQLSIAESRADVQAALPADTAVLAYFVGDVRSHAWLLTRTEFRHEVLPGRRALQNLVHTFVDRQRARREAPGDPVFAPLLGNLLAGVAVKRLLVLPDGPLNGLPFAALPLPDGRSRELLMDRFVISAAPSLALALQRRPATGAAATRVAVISDPVYTPDDRRLTLAFSGRPNYRGAEPDLDQLARLPYSAIEARAVVRAFEGADVIELAGFNATARRVIELPSNDLRVLHFATHAVAHREAPEQSALFLSEYAADGSRLAADRLTAEDIALSGLRADVVVLSGCATGDGRELRGEGVLGLTYGFLANGSRTVIASLWPVEDALTARFMEEFYTAYRDSGGAADALRVAQLRTRGARASSVWASFVVRTSELP